MNLSFQDQEVAQASGQGPASKCLRAALSLGLPVSRSPKTVAAVTRPDKAFSQRLMH